METQLVLLASRARKQDRPGELPPRLSGVVTKKVDCLAHLEDRVDQRLPSLANAQREELFRMLLIKVGGAVEQPGSRFAAKRVPLRLRCVAGPRHAIHFVGTGLECC